MNLGLSHKCAFVMAKITKLISADLKKYYYLLLDLLAGRLLDGKTLYNTRCIIQSSKQNSITVITSKSQEVNKIQKLLQKYPNALKLPQLQVLMLNMMFYIIGF